MTVAAAHAAGWTWDIGLAGARGIGTVFSSDHMRDDEALAILTAYTGRADIEPRLLPFEPGYRPEPWVRNCVAIGLSGGFLEPLESTGLVLIEAAVAMLAELFPQIGPVDAPAKRFNDLMTARYEAIINFLKLHYCLSERPEPFWRENTSASSITPRLQELLAQWRYRPPSRFDFTLDVESFAFFNYQYVLYGMGYATHADLPAAIETQGAKAAEKIFRRIRTFGDRAAADLPSHRALVSAIAQPG
ncbi:tryptophan 7-halogenase [Sandaracinobacteroides hominis]|uniref:tryptophan 7-halogenase n=1 Tax=Sandaracinobacteroides hominis TaxID=2780086 RepID=UPI002E2DC5BC|nr:tryptophan 7-halogenase [Sandaracinobacteroides hominis]